MSDPRTGIQQSGPGETPEARRPDEEHQVRAAVRELVDLLERAISRSLFGPVLWVCICLIPAVTLLVLGLADRWGVGVGVPLFFVALGVVIFLAVLGSLAGARGGVAALLDEGTLIRIVARRFAKRFPEGLPERPLAIRMLSGINTPHKAGRKLLRALPGAEKPPPFPVVILFGGLILFLPVAILGVEIGHRLEAWGIDESIGRFVYGAFLGALIGVLMACGYWRVLKAALISIPVCAIMFGGLMVVTNYRGWWAPLVYFAGLVLFVSVEKVFSRSWRRTASPDQRAAASSPHE